METISIFNQYEVYVGSGLLGKIGEIINLDKFSKIIVIADIKIPTQYLSNFEKITISSGEENKNIETVEFIWNELLKLGADRKTLVINLGGGVIGDMGGFAASCYMRGIEFLQVPTTLLSAVDASVGGKVGIDFSGIKNLIGSFNQPIGVIVDIDTFNSLPDREFISGFGEIIKHGLIANSEYFKFVTSKKPREFSQDELIQIIKKSCEIKASIISGDEKESGSRKLLNFGHTIGHALESASLETVKPLLHGEAVSIGAIAEAKISFDLELIEDKELSTIQQAMEAVGLPVSFKITNMDKIMELISKDKKSQSGKVNWTLINGIGSAVIDNHVEDGIVRSALEYISR